MSLKDLEPNPGLVPVADLAEREPQVGDEVSVEVVGVNISLRRITLAMR
ncbi:hypothetical protein [Streptomyces sp. NPDC059909]